MIFITNIVLYITPSTDIKLLCQHLPGPTMKTMAPIPQCIFDFWKNRRIRNKQMFTNAHAFSRVSYFLYFFCVSHMFCGKNVVVVFLWNHIHICMPLFLVFYIRVWRDISQEYKNIASYHPVLSCILNSPRSKYFIKFSLMVFDSQICSVNTMPQVRSCWLITH